MAKFNRLLDADFQPPRTWILDLSLAYDSDCLNETEAACLKAVGAKINKNMKITVPKGFKTDLASVPRIGWIFVAPFDIARAGVVHDYLYYCIRQYRANLGTDQDIVLVENAKVTADKVFKEAMDVSADHVSGWKKWVAWKTVALFGGSSIVPRDEL
tara:strand:- start:288 stop:758 length:471 start_codon:yes stop_codon:yes gene_type:complete